VAQTKVDGCRVGDMDLRRDGRSVPPGAGAAILVQSWVGHCAWLWYELRVWVYWRGPRPIVFLWKSSRSMTGPDPQYHLRNVYLAWLYVNPIWHCTMCDRVMMAALLLTVGRDDV